LRRNGKVFIKLSLAFSFNGEANDQAWNSVGRFHRGATLITPAIAQEATQEPGVFGYNYPNTFYMTGGYGVRATPGPRYYYQYRGYPRDYGWNQYRLYPPVGAFATAPWADTSGYYGSYAYYGEPETVWIAP
jgi:hypothetical protein